MKAKVKGKRSPAAVKKCKVSSDCGRMKYLGIDMAFIHVRGKRMLTMSEVARKLYPQWPRTTLSCRMRQLNIPRHLCTPRQMQKVYSVNGIVKQGINCRLISKEDLDTFCRVYKVNEAATVKEMASKTGVRGKRTQASTSDRGQNSHRHLKGKASSFAAPGRLAKNELVVSKQSQRDKNGTRVLKRSKAGKVLGHKRHVAFGVNKAKAKQPHVVKSCRSHGVINGRLPNSSLTKNKSGVRKRTHFEITNGGISVSLKINRNATTKKRRKGRETSSPASDASLDSGISSLALDTPLTPSKTTWRNNKKVTQRVPLATQTKSQNKKKAKDMKMKPKKEKVKTKVKQKWNKSGTKRKSGKIHSDKKGKLEPGSKKLKTAQSQRTGSDTITKEFVMKMNLKHMNDKDLINSFSLASSPSSTPENATPVEDPPYFVKLMPVKPVWRVNSSFRFISNFLLPPSLIVKDGDLKPACSMICQPGLRPPGAHPIWKWKVGEPVVGNKTEISYRMKKVKCIGSPNKKT